MKSSALKHSDVAPTLVAPPRLTILKSEVTESLVSPLYNGKPVPWHGTGVTLLNKFHPLTDALKATGLDWEVAMDQCCMSDGTPIPSAKVIYRRDTKAIFDVVGTRYKPLQNTEAFAWFQPFITSRMATIESAGTLKDGKIVWILAKPTINSVQIVEGDEVSYYILLCHSHDGTISIRAGFIPVRMCNWTFLSQSRNLPSNMFVNVKHTETVKLDMETVKVVMKNAHNDFVHTTEQYKKMAAFRMNNASALSYFKKVITEAKGVKKDIEITLDKLMFLFENSTDGMGNKVAGTTLWAAYNAVAELNTWYRGRSTDTRLQSLFFGQYGESNTKALEVALDLLP